MGLNGWPCIVTGGSSGIGRAVAKGLLDEGANVMIVGRDQDRLDSARRELEDGQGAIHIQALDVTSEGAAASLLAAAEDRLGGIKALVNSAGSARLADLEAEDEGEWYEQWELNVMATKQLMDVACPAIARAGGGAIVNVCSSAGRRPSSANAAYSVTKRAELALSKVYAERYRSAGVAVGAVAPGPVASPLWLGPGGRADEMAAIEDESPEQVMNRVAAALPLKRLAEPAEVAAVIVLMIARGGTVNGSTWAVDGGHVPDVAN